MSTVSMVSVSSQLPVEAEDTRELDTAEDVLRLTVRRGSTRRCISSCNVHVMIVPCCGVGRYSVVSAVSGRSLVMLDLPIIVVTGPHDQAEAAESGWDQGYKNFKFRCREAEKQCRLYFISLQAEEKFEGTRGGGGAKGGETQARPRLHRQYKRCGESAEDEAQAEKETT